MLFPTDVREFVRTSARIKRNENSPVVIRLLNWQIENRCFRATSFVFSTMHTNRERERERKDVCPKYLYRLCLAAYDSAAHSYFTTSNGQHKITVKSAISTKIKPKLSIHSYVNLIILIKIYKFIKRN